MANEETFNDEHLEGQVEESADVKTEETVVVENKSSDNDNEVEEEYEEMETLDSIPNMTSLQTTSSVLSATSSYTEVKDMAEAMVYMQQLANVFIKSKLSPLKKAEDVILAIVTGNQYGFPPLISISNIYPIQGRPAMSTHMIRALILKNKILFNKIYENEPMYIYYKAEEIEGKIVAKKVKDAQGKEHSVPFKVATIHDQINELVIRGNNVVDNITKYEFTRLMQMPDGSWREQKVTSEFKWSDAVKAELHVKDNWKNYPARMLDSKAFNIGAKEIADDILMGIYSISDLADTFGVNYTISPNLEERIKE